jgi:ADP-heptose:LPS heptosyltransferase/lauroyl/myristoyl acyltransferase
VLKLLLHSLGWLLAHTPEPLLRGVSVVLGEVTLWAIPRRRRLVFSNLDHAFPDRPTAWKRRMARESSRRLVETALLSLALPCLGPDRLRTMIKPSPGMLRFFTAQSKSPFPAVLAAPHLAYWEIQTAMALVLPEPYPEVGVIFRPLDNPAADAWVKRMRERFGMKLLSRKQGFQEALKILRRNGVAIVLFDQNAGLQGALSLLMGRVCSTTELPGLMAEKFGAAVYSLYQTRTAFWRVELNLERVEAPATAAGVTLALNRWLETELGRDDRFCASWLWMHDRWRNQDMPAKRYRLEAKRNLLAEDLAARGLAEIPRQTRIFVRLPNWLGDVVMVLPLLRALRASRPDAAITLLAKAPFLPLLKDWHIADELVALPPPGLGYFLFFRRLRPRYPDNYLLFTNSFRGDLEAWLTGCRQRFGIVRPGKRRPLLTHAYRVPAGFDERKHHQLKLWTDFMNHFGLNAPPDITALAPAGTAAPQHPLLGLIAGSENNPEKRWPVEHWRSLIAQLPPTLPIVLFGTANDRAITTAIAQGFGPRVENLAGKTGLPEYCARLTACSLLIANDTGGMHLANALGVPLLALFGPTNPVRTQPVFDAPVFLLQPPGCPETGGGRLADLTPARVLDTLRRLAPGLVPPN